MTSVINAAGTLARTLNKLSQTVTDTNTDAQQQIQQDVTTINTTLQSIADINQQIAQHTGNEDVTDEEDQRDQLVSTLSGLIGVTTFTKADGELAVYTTDGKPLVDATVATLAVGGTTGITW